MAAGAEQLATQEAEHVEHSTSVFAHEPGTWFHPLAKALHLPDYIVISWAVIVLLCLFAVLATRKRSTVPGRLQCLAELIVEGLNNYLKAIIGPGGPKYAPWVSTLFIYIFCINVIGLIPGMVSPSTNPNTTISLAILTFFYVQAVAIVTLGPIAYVKHLCGEPLWLAPLAFPIHVIGELAKPVSLGIRLLGNIFGEDMVIVQLVLLAVGIMRVIKVPIPIQLPLMAFGLFTSFVQALVFATLAAIYIALFVAHGDGHKEAHGHHQYTR